MKKKEKNQVSSNFILIKDNVLSLKECNKLIKTYKKNLKSNKKLDYFYNDIVIQEVNFLEKLEKLIKLYVKTYPEVNMTSSQWALDTIRYKLFKKGQSFNHYHSEVSLTSPYRVLSVLIYLTSHKPCQHGGTIFYRNKQTIESKAGRVCIFPAYFTHTHKGQPDLKKERSIISGYYSFWQKGVNEVSEF